MKTLCVLLVTYLTITIDLFVPVSLQSVQTRHYRPLPQKCDRHGRCSAKEEVDEDDGYRSEKDRPPELTRDDWPIRPMSEDDYDRKKDTDKVDDSKSSAGRPVGGGGYNPKPAVDDEKISDGRPGSGYDLKPGRDDDIKDGGRPRGGGGGYGGGGYIPKPVEDRDDDSVKPTVSRPSGGGSGYGSGGYKPKPAVDRDDDPKPPVSRPGVSGGGYGGSSYKPKPAVERDDDPKPPVSRPSGTGGDYDGGSYKPKPAVDRDDDDLKPPLSRPGVSGGGYGGGGYKPKPAVDRDDDDLKPPVSRLGVSGGGYGGGGYKPKPAVDRDDDDLKPPVNRPGVSGGGYKPKPAVDRDDDDDLKPPASRPGVSGGGYGGGGYKPKPAVDRDDDPKPPVSRPSVSGGGYGGGGYKPKPAVDRDDDLIPTVNRPAAGGGGYGGGGYKPKPAVNRDDDIEPEVSRPSSGGGGYRGSYNPKPEGNRGGGGGYNPKTDDDGYKTRPVRRGGESYYPDSDRNSNKDDLGGYDQPKDDDYDNYETGRDEKDDDNEGKPVSVVEGNCICVPYYQCKSGHIVTDGAGIIDARMRRDPPNSEGELPLDGKFQPPSCGAYHVCCNTPETSTVKPYEHRCGSRNPSGINSRILSPSNKGEADFGEWPWQAAVLKSEGKVNIFLCGGVLIDKYHILTVAHCVFHLYQLNDYPLKVRLGEWDTQTTTEFLAHEDYKVAKITIHPDFRNDSLKNDIAVLKLQDPVLFAPHIDTVCLPKYDEVFSDQNCVVTGWGKDAYKGGTFSNVMKEVALQVIDNYKCEEMLRKTRLGRFFQLYEGFLCAGGEYGLDSCKGDGGGPLVCYRKDKSYALAGIVSWGIDCGQPGVPGVYVKMQKYLDWISKSTGVTLEDYWPKQ